MEWKFQVIGVAPTNSDLICGKGTSGEKHSVKRDVINVVLPTCSIQFVNGRPEKV